MNARGPLAAVALLLLGAAAEARAQEKAEPIRIKGSDTIGSLLGAELTRAYRADHREAEIEWQSLGSSTAFVGLLDASADVGASSRPIRGEELAELQQAGISLDEHVIGYDAIAIIVHPSNPLSEISGPTLVEIFAGRAREWRPLGGQNMGVFAVSLPSYSGTHALFRELVMGRERGEAEPFSATTEFVETGKEIVQAVARDRRAIGYVGLGFTGSAKVKVIALSQPGRPATLPTERTIRDGSYPLARPLYLYTRSDAPARVRAFVAFALSRQGQKRVASSGLFARDLSPSEPAVAEAPAQSEAPAAAGAPPVRIPFGPKSRELASADRKVLDTLAKRLLESSERLLITGHSDGMRPLEENPRYSRERADAVAAYLKEQGVSAERLEVEGRAETQPLASNRSEQGRKQNRRVDVHLLIDPSARKAKTDQAASTGTSTAD